MKTIEVIECRRCGGSFYSGKHKMALSPGNEKELPDEIYILVRKIPTCLSCQEQASRTLGMNKKNKINRENGY